jgi:hypothetical protein
MAEGAKTGVVEGVKSAAGGLVDAAGDYLKTPMGMYQAGSALQGWSQGQALQEQWDAMDEREKERYNSWVNGGASRMPRLTVDSV